MGQFGFSHIILIKNSYDLSLIVPDNQTYGFSFQPQKGCDAAATLEKPLIPPYFKNESQKLSFYGLIVI